MGGASESQGKPRESFKKEDYFLLFWILQIAWLCGIHRIISSTVQGQVHFHESGQRAPWLPTCCLPMMRLHGLFLASLVTCMALGEYFENTEIREHKF